MSIRRWAAELLEAHPAERCVDLDLGGWRVRVRSNSGALCGALESYFGPTWTADGDAEPDRVITALDIDPPDFGEALTDWKREPGKKLKEAFADLPDGRLLKKVRTGMQFLLGDDVRMALGPALDNSNQVINFVNAEYMNRGLQRGAILCHAAGVTRGGRGLMIAAVSGGGKSTLALHLMRLGGLGYVSNDRVMVRRQGERLTMEGVPKWPRVNPGTLLNNPDLIAILPDGRAEELGRMGRDELWDLEEKYDVPLDRIYGADRVRLTAPLEGLLLLNWNLSDGTSPDFERVDLHERRDLLPIITKPAGPFYRATADEAPKGVEAVDEAPYVELLSQVPVWEARGGIDFDDAVELVLSRLLPERA